MKPEADKQNMFPLSDGGEPMLICVSGHRAVFTKPLASNYAQFGIIFDDQETPGHLHAPNRGHYARQRTVEDRGPFLPKFKNFN